MHKCEKVPATIRNPSAQVNSQQGMWWVCWLSACTQLDCCCAWGVTPQTRTAHERRREWRGHNTHNTCQQEHAHAHIHLCARGYTHIFLNCNQKNRGTIGLRPSHGSRGDAAGCMQCVNVQAGNQRAAAVLGPRSQLCMSQQLGHVPTRSAAAWKAGRRHVRWYSNPPRLSSGLAILCNTYQTHPATQEHTHKKHTHTHKHTRPPAKQGTTKKGPRQDVETLTAACHRPQEHLLPQAGRATPAPATTRPRSRVRGGQSSSPSSRRAGGGGSSSPGAAVAQP
jgi:hypothetical protein